MVLAAYISIAAGTLWFALTLYVSFNTEGGAIGMVPVLDGAVVAPSFLWMGLGLARWGGGWPGWPWWAFFVSWLLSVVVAGWLVVSVGKVGRHYHRRLNGRAK